jgi:hypothetical protein
MKAKIIVVVAMVGGVLTAVLGQGAVQVRQLDNSGTTRGVLIDAVSQTAARQWFVMIGSFQAERAGFSDGLPATVSRLQQL